MNQTEWVAEMFQKAFPVKGFMAKFPDGTRKMVIHLRGLHYYIVELPENVRQIPSTKGTRLYENTKNDYKRLSKVWKKAQLKGLIDSDLIWDNKNTFMKNMPSRRRMGLDSLDYKVNIGFYFNFDIGKVKTYEEFKESADIKPNFNNNRFVHQWYEIVVVTEKLTVEAAIEDVCEKYGANELTLKGQSSYTRIRDCCLKAMKSNRPLLLLGIYDLDCAGWDMPTAFMNTVNEIYPHQDHKFIRIALNRDQAEKYNLVVSFEPDDKGYKKAQKERFYRESGGRTCIELDALDNKIIRDELEKVLKQYSGLKIDAIQQKRFEKKTQKRVGRVIENFDFDPYEKKYERAYKRYMKFYDTIKEVQDYLKAKYNFLNNRFWDVKDEIKTKLEEEIENNA